MADSCCIAELRETIEKMNVELCQSRTKISELDAKVREQEEENTRLAKDLKECEEKYRVSQEMLLFAEQKSAQFSQELQATIQKTFSQIRRNRIKDGSSSCSDGSDSDEDRRNLIINSSSSCSDAPDSNDSPTQMKHFQIKESSDTALNINSMREEILNKIFGYLSHNDLGQTAQVCTRWNALSRNPDLWNKVNVYFRQNRGAQNLVAECFINILPPRVTSLTLNFWNNDFWIDLLNFEEISVRLHKKCPMLKTLMLENAKISVNLPSIIDICTMLLPNLRRLALHSSIFPNCPSTEEEWDETCKIKVLDLFGCYITHYNKPPLSRMPCLKKLFLACTDVDDSWFEDIIYFLRQLHELDLRDTDISSRTFQVLYTHAPNLRELYLCDTGVNLDEEDDLNFNTSIFPHLKTICLRYNEVSCEGIISLIKACKSLRNVYVDGGVVDSFEEHSFVNYNECKLGIVKDDCCYYKKSRYFE